MSALLYVCSAISSYIAGPCGCGKLEQSLGDWCRGGHHGAFAVRNAKSLGSIYEVHRNGPLGFLACYYRRDNQVERVP
jgi:hypothetical protein